MALPLGKLTILIGAGPFLNKVLLGQCLLEKGAYLMYPIWSPVLLRQLKQGEPAKSASKRHNDTLTAQVNSLRHELQLLVSNRPITIILAGGSGGRKYGFIIIIGVIGYGYVWWKGTKRELTSEIERMDRTLDGNIEIIKETDREVTELRDGTENMKDEVRSVFEAVESLASKVYRIEGNQDLTLKGVGALHAQCLEHKRVQESNKTPSLPPASPRESSSTPNGSPQSISEGSSSRETFSNGKHSGEAMGNTTSSSLFSMFLMPRIGRTRSEVNAKSSGPPQ